MVNIFHIILYSIFSCLLFVPLPNLGNENKNKKIKNSLRMATVNNPKYTWISSKCHNFTIVSHFQKFVCIFRSYNRSCLYKKKQKDWSNFHTCSRNPPKSTQNCYNFITASANPGPSMGVYSSAGCNMGHTAPVPANTIPVTGNLHKGTGYIHRSLQ